MSLLVILVQFLLFGHRLRIPGLNIRKWRQKRDGIFFVHPTKKWGRGVTNTNVLPFSLDLHSPEISPSKSLQASAAQAELIPGDFQLKCILPQCFITGKFVILARRQAFENLGQPLAWARTLRGHQVRQHWLRSGWRGWGSEQGGTWGEIHLFPVLPGWSIISFSISKLRT